ncbi:hypothetical protein MHU86_10482 [Fragilaria crotonensis]|nr:hypothetical protein MHU86_10482 [Fragilaria crotonensis]
MTPIKNQITKRKNRNLIQLSRQLLDFLKDPDNGFVTITSKVDLAVLSKDGATTKLAVRLHDDHLVESVLMRYINKDGGRASLCVSSQVGCAMGCTFCATGTMGIRGNLSAAEILEQVVHANRILATEMKENNLVNDERRKKLELVRNIVFMGMGEPLNNYANVVEACRCLIDRKRWNFAFGKITVSTVGVTPRIRDLTRDLPEVCLALSLHAPNQEMRSAIVPAANAYKIEGLIEALDNHMMAYLKKRFSGDYTDEERIKESTRRRAMIEYVMLEGPTSSLECAHQLGKLCQNRHLLVNLIPYNQTDVKDKLRCPSEQHMRQFQDIVSSYNTFCTIRRTMGADIASACGQLVVQTAKEVDIEDAVRSKTEITVSTRTTAVKRSPVSPATDKKVKDDDLNRFVKPLAIATSIAAACFVVSATVFLRQRSIRIR